VGKCEQSRRQGQLTRKKRMVISSNNIAADLLKKVGNELTGVVRRTFKRSLYTEGKIGGKGGGTAEAVLLKTPVGGYVTKQTTKNWVILRGKRTAKM